MYWPKSAIFAMFVPSLTVRVPPVLPLLGVYLSGARVAKPMSVISMESPGPSPETVPVNCGALSNLSVFAIGTAKKP